MKTKKKLQNTKKVDQERILKPVRYQENGTYALPTGGKKCQRKKKERGE